MAVCESHLDEVSRSRKEGSAHLICPGCYTQYDLPEHTSGKDRPICPECGLPLLRSEENRKKFKCLRCMHRAVVPDGVWCRQYNCPATAEIARNCRHFASRSKRKSRR